MHGSGKSVMSYAAQTLGFHAVSMGDIVREELARRGLKSTNENIRDLSIRIRKEMGPAAVAVLSFKTVDQQHSKVLFDGLRSLDEYYYFKANFEHCVLISIHASPKTRYERWIARKRIDDPIDFDDFLERDKVELGFGLGSLMVMADYHLVNEQLSLEKFRQKCIRLLLTISAGIG
jgi:dephospho-CoA kinase